MHLLVKSFLVAIILIAIGTKVYSQDVHFSQRLASNQQRNSAFANNFDGLWSGMTVYRQQWNSVGIPFTTSAVFFTRQFYSNIPNLKFFGGLSYYHDQSGDGRLALDQFNLNTGVHYLLGKDAITIAISNSFALKSFNPSQLTFPGQYDRSIGGFNKKLNNGENFAQENIGYYDLAWGARWDRDLNKGWKLTTGISLLHIFEPQETFFDAENNKSRGYGIQLQATKDLSGAMQLLPSLSFYRSNGASETVLGTDLRFQTASLGPVEQLQPFLYLRTGPDRLNDALIIGSYAGFGNFQFGLSYDINISELEVASNHQGGFEISLIYIAKEPKLSTKRIPCVRY